MQTFAAIPADILAEMLDLYLEAAPWLIVGFVAAGLVHAYVPDGLMGRWLGGRGVMPVIKAAVLGAPLPLCSCGVLPAAVGLRREGASKGATVSFLIATPETGPDSVAISYALLGPVMAVVRPLAAVLSAIVAGLMTLAVTRNEAQSTPLVTIAGGSGESCSSGTCCSGSCSSSTLTDTPATPGAKLKSGLRYAMTDILDDIAPWLAVGLAVAGVLGAVVPPQGLADYGTGLPAMLVMLAVGVPLYVCATASTPIAAGLLAVGVSPGAALVFLLAGPATNIATLGVVGKDLGARALAAYLGGIALSALALGWALDFGLAAAGVDIEVQMDQAGEVVPDAVKWASALVLAPFFARSLYREVKKRLP